MASLTAKATTWYVDSQATGNKNGTSWDNAWTAINQIKEISPDDTVLISGGPFGQSRTYVVSSPWNPLPGTYQIGQDSDHNGLAVFQPKGSWLSGAISNVIISGDAGDGKMHFQLADSSAGFVFDGAGSSHVRIAYVNCGKRMDGFQLDGVSAIEVDHCWLYKMAEETGDADHVCYIANKVATWDDSSFHDNTFYIPRDLAGSGDDCIQGASDGFTFSHNLVIGYTTNYTGRQHQDGLQPLGGSYIKIYDNYFQDIGNYAVFFDAYYADFSHCLVYNNVIVLTDARVQISDPPEGIVIGPDGGAKDQMKRWPTFTDIVVANNLVVDYTGHASIHFGNYPNTAGPYSGCVLKNNISVNGGGVLTDIVPYWTPKQNPGIDTRNNVELTLSSGDGHFVRYTPLMAMPPNDFHLLAKDSLCRGKGANLSSYFKTDKDGNSRPSSGAWDIGPYQADGISTPNSPPRPTPP